MSGSSKDAGELFSKKKKEFEDFVKQLQPKKYEDGWPEDRWEEEMEKHPFFMSKPLTEGQELPPLVEALQQLKYDHDMNTPRELARAYKDDGNENFRKKKYSLAVHSYTHALNLKISDNYLNSVLYANRAAAHYHIGNYQKALNDATEARALKPNHMKAIQRGAQCCLKLKLFKECISWCDKGLKIDREDLELQDCRKIAVKEKKSIDRDKRKALVQEERQKKERLKLLRAIKDRGINLNTQFLNINSAKLESAYPQFADTQVTLDSNECLLWPVLLLYPEYEVTDVIQHFHEDTSFTDQLSTVFSTDNIPSWDKEKKYKLDDLQIYFSHQDNSELVMVDKDQTLKSVLADDRIVIDGGTPVFFITVKNSAFDKAFKKKNGNSS